MSEEEKYNDLKNLLKSLPKVKSRNDFETNLFRRLREIESGKYSPRRLWNLPVRPVRFGWLTNVVKPAYISAVGVTVLLLICVVLYFSYLPNKNQTIPQVTQSTSTEGNKTEQPPLQNENLGITKNETTPSDRTTIERRETIPYIPELEKPSSDREITIPSPVEKSETIAPSERSIEAEQKTMDKEVKKEEKTDGLRKSESQEAPVMKKDEKLNKEDEVLQKVITPSMNEENVMGKDTNKSDSMKVMSKMKKVGKKALDSKDSLKNQPSKKPVLKDEKQPDTTK